MQWNAVKGENFRSFTTYFRINHIGIFNWYSNNHLFSDKEGKSKSTVRQRNSQFTLASFGTHKNGRNMARSSNRQISKHII